MLLLSSKNQTQPDQSSIFIRKLGKFFVIKGFVRDTSAPSLKPPISSQVGDKTLIRLKFGAFVDLYTRRLLRGVDSNGSQNGRRTFTNSFNHGIFGNSRIRIESSSQDCITS